MKNAVAELIGRHWSRGVLIDTNVLLLLFVGGFDRDLVPRFKRTRQFTPEDYDLLARLVEAFERIVTTPNILSEVNSLCGQLGEPARTEYFRIFARRIRTLDEHYVASKDVSTIEQFPKLGLTDSGILHLAGEQYLVLTDDFELEGFLRNAKIHVLNFNHIRPLSPDSD